MIREILKNEAFLRDIEKLYFVAKKIDFGTRIGDSVSKRVGRSLEFKDYKSYQPGDDLRSIDWNLYGRLNKLYLKLFHEEVDLNIYIFIDSSLSMCDDDGKGGKKENSKLLYAQKLAAAISYIALNSLNSVGVVSFSDSVEQFLPPSRKKTHIYPIFDFLENISPQKDTNINQAMKSFVMRKGVSSGAALILSDFFSPPGYQEGIKYLIHKGFSVNMIQILSPEDKNPAIIGKARIQDIESYSASNFYINEIILKKYKEKLNKYIDGLNKFCTMYNVPYLHTTSGTPFEETVLRFFMVQNR